MLKEEWTLYTVPGDGTIINIGTFDSEYAALDYAEKHLEHRIDRYYLNNRPVHFNRKISNYNSGFNDFVEAIHIWLKDGYKPMADLAFISGGVKTIAWDDIEEREKYSFGINAYTIIYDDRAGQSFESHIR